MKIDFTNDYRIDCALTDAANLAVAVGTAVAKGVLIALVVVTGASTIRGALWRVAGAVNAVTLVTYVL